MNDYTKHYPVLLSEVLQYLSPMEGDSYLDLTAGYGGHAEALLDRTLKPHNTTLVIAIKTLYSTLVKSSMEVAFS